MAFKKIRETIDAFKTVQESEPYVSSADKSLNQVDEPVENLTIDLLILVLIFVASIQIAKIMHWLIDPDAAAFDTWVSTIVAMSSAFVIGQFHERILASIKRMIPEQKIKKALNPYFGSKLRETILAFKKAR